MAPIEDAAIDNEDHDNKDDMMVIMMMREREISVERDIWRERERVFYQKLK